jgi:hypothetical protein
MRAQRKRRLINMTTDSSRQLGEDEYTRAVQEAATEGDLEKLRDLLKTEIGQSRLEGFDLDPESDSDLKAMMRSLRRQLEEGKAFKRGILSEGRPPTELEQIAMDLGLTPDTLILGSFEQERRRGKGKEK